MDCLLFVLGSTVCKLCCDTCILLFITANSVPSVVQQWRAYTKPLLLEIISIVKKSEV